MAEFLLSNEGSGSIGLAAIISLVSLHVFVIFSCTMLKELLIESRKTMGCPLIFCCDQFNFWYILIIFIVW